MESPARTSVSPARRQVLGLLGHGVLLAGCGGYDVLRSGDAGAHMVLAPQSLKVVLFDRNVDLKMLNHERGHGLAPAPLRPEDKRQLRAHAEQLKPMLVQALLQGVSNSLSRYISARDPAFQLGLQINRIALDLDGSVDVVVSATLTRAGGARNALWTRTVRAGRNQFGSDAVSAAIWSRPCWPKCGPAGWLPDRRGLSKTDCLSGTAGSVKERAGSLSLRLFFVAALSNEERRRRCRQARFLELSFLTA